MRPEYYGGEMNPFEPIKIIHHYNLNFNRGSILKYLLRPGKGQIREDLMKIKQYVDFELQRLDQEDKNESISGMDKINCDLPQGQGVELLNKWTIFGSGGSSREVQETNQGQEWSCGCSCSKSDSK